MIRKIKRNILRTTARKKGVKASKYINSQWFQLQTKKFGVDLAKLHRYIGSGKGVKRKATARRIAKEGAAV